MRSAAVGQQCVDCVGEGATSVPRVRTASDGRPYVTYALIAANVVMFVAQAAISGLQQSLFLWPAGVAAYDQYYRLLTSAFLHENLLHILFNMVALYMIGPHLERLLGPARFLAVYLLAALGGSVGVYVLDSKYTAVVGASGA